MQLNCVFKDELISLASQQIRWEGGPTELRYLERGMPHPGNKIHIPLPEREADRLPGKVKPAADMPGQGPSPTKANKKQQKRPRTLTSAP